MYRIFQLYFEHFECTTIKKRTGFVSFHFSIIWTVKPGTLKCFSLSAIVMSFLAHWTVIKCLPDEGKFLQQIRYILKVSNVVRKSFGLMDDSNTKLMTPMPNLF